MAAFTTLGFMSGAARAEVRVERGDGADSCPDGDTFASRIHDGSAPRADASRDVTVRFERTPMGYRSSVFTADGMRRTLVDDAANCDGLTEATLLAVKLALDVSDVPAPAS